MRKFFSFRSSVSSNAISDRAPPEPIDNEKAYWDTINKANISVKQPEGQNSDPCPVLRRSLSFSSATYGGGMGERNFISMSPSSSSNSHSQSADFLLDRRSLTPERHKAKRRDKASSRKVHGVDKPESPSSSKGYHNSSGNSFCGSPPAPVKFDSSRLMHASNKVLDLYIDGEQQQQERTSRTKSQRITSNNGAGSGWRPPRIQATAPGSPTDFGKEKLRSHSFRDMRDTYYIHAKKEIGPESSPQKLARNVVDRLSQVFPRKPKTKSREFSSDTPTTVEDILEDFMDPNPSSNSDEVTQKRCILDGPYKEANLQNGEEMLDFHGLSTGDAPVAMYSRQTEEDLDVELHQKAMEAHEKLMLISEELEQERYCRDNGFSVSELFQTIRSLTEERRSLAQEVSTQIRSRISERESAREALRVAKVELDTRTRRLEKEKNELQSGLEKELDRRSSDWSFKLEKYQSEEQRLRERVRELAEQNVSLQREVSSLSGKEVESRTKMAHSESQLKDLTARLEELRTKNYDLEKTVSELEEKYRGAEADKDCIQRSYRENEKENKQLEKTVARLQRTCSEQDKTIAGLRQGLSDETGRKESFGSDSLKWQIEQLRLTGVEQKLRREVESYRLEVESLRHENINLLDRLRSSTKGGYSSFKLDQELQDRVDCLQYQGLSLFGECSDLCEKLLRFYKGESNINGSRHAQEAGKIGFDGYFLVESNMKVQSFKRGIENLTRSLQKISSVLHEKPKDAGLEYLSECSTDYGSQKLKDRPLENDIEVKFKEETLLTCLLREKLFSQQMELEQLQTELATAARGHDILRSEVQGALDSLSSASHKMKDLELQVLRRDDSINQLKSDLQECKKDLSMKNGILPKISEERDLMWEEVKQYSEKNMLLNSEVNFLKKKIENLDEDIHLKEGQITILKDSLNSKPFDMLYSPKSMHEKFILE